MLRHIQFPHLDHGSIGNLLGVKSLTFGCPLRGIEGNYLIPSAVQTKLESTLAGEYQLNKNRQQRHSPTRKHRPFVFQVTCNKTTEKLLDYLKEELWKTEQKGITAPNKNYSSDNKLALQTLDNTTALLVRTSITSCSAQQYSSSTPPQRYNIEKQLELWVNCLSPHHLRANCVLNNHCQECNWFHHTSLHGQKKLFLQRPPSFGLQHNSPNLSRNTLGLHLW